jgi:hypothetical protein
MCRISGLNSFAEVKLQPVYQPVVGKLQMNPLFAVCGRVELSFWNATLSSDILFPFLPSLQRCAAAQDLSFNNCSDWKPLWEREQPPSILYCISLSLSLSTIFYPMS